MGQDQRIYFKDKCCAPTWGQQDDRLNDLLAKQCRGSIICVQMTIREHIKHEFLCEYHGYKYAESLRENGAYMEVKVY